MLTKQNQNYTIGLSSSIENNSVKIFVCMDKSYKNGMSKVNRVKYTTGDWLISESDREYLQSKLDKGVPVYIFGVGKENKKRQVKTCFQVLDFNTVNQSDWDNGKELTRTVFRIVEEVKGWKHQVQFTGTFGRGYQTVLIQE